MIQARPVSSRAEGSARPPYYPALTGLRAIAALLVFFTHFNPFEDELLPRSWAWKFVHQGHFGVPIFFVLSGFLIAARYMGRVQTTWQWFGKYLQNRVARIYPLYFLLTALTFWAYQANPAFDGLHLWQTHAPMGKVVVMVLNFTLLRGFFGSYFVSGISQGWSLTVEETFYVLAPLMLLTVAGKAWRLVLWALGLLATGWLLATFFTPLSVVWRGFFGSVGFMYEWTFFGHSFEFVVGMALAMRIARQGPVARKGTWATYAGMAWVVSCAVFMATPGLQPVALSPGWLKILTINFLLPPGVCLLFFGLLREQSVVRRGLETKVFGLLGRSSYAFYLVHQGILSVLLHRLNCSIPVSLLITVLVSIALFKLVEEPLHNRLRARLI